LIDVVQVVEHLSEEQQLHRDLLILRRDDRARQIEDLRHDVEQQRQQLSNYKRTVAQLQGIVTDLLSHQASTNNTDATTAAPVTPIGMPL